MLTIDQTTLKFSNMGLFDSDSDWIHPTVTIDSFELIYVVAGEIHLREENTSYHLKKGEMLLLEAGREHGGTHVSHGHTSFYWLHFYTNDISTLVPQKQSTPPQNTVYTFQELMHLQETDHTLAELVLARFLMESNIKRECGNRTAHEIAEFIRIHSNFPLTVTEIAQRFGYSPDHLSRLLRREFGYDTKTCIVKKRLEYIESLLINTDHSIKEIAEQCGFDDENKFVKFFKYHKNLTPSEFRNQYFHIHMNTK